MEEPNADMAKKNSLTRNDSYVTQYDPFAKPANIELARRHGRAKRVYQFDDNPVLDDLCICCGLPVHGMEIPIFSDISALYHFGPGYAMYFKFYQYCVVLLGIMFMISGAYNIYTNYEGGQCDTNSEATEYSYCVQGPLTSLTIANKRDNLSQMSIVYELNLICTIVLIIYFKYVRYRMKKLEIEADERTITPSDYTVEIMGLPTEDHTLTTIEGITSWLESFSNEENPVLVKKVVLCYDTEDYCKKLNTKANFVKKNKHDEYGDQIHKIDQEIRDMEEKGLKFVGTAYVSFERAEQAEYIKKTFQHSRLQKLWINTKIVLRIVFGWFDRFEEDDIVIRRAPEPNEIQWNNLKYTKYDKMVTRIGTAFKVTFMIMIGFLILVYLTSIQVSNIETVTQHNFEANLISYGVSLALIVIAPVIVMLCVYFSKAEKHDSITTYGRSVANRVVFYKFIKMSFTIILARLIILTDLASFLVSSVGKIQSVDFYSEAGIIKNTMIALSTTIILNPVLTLVDFGYFIKVFKKFLARRNQGKDLTQGEAHLLFEGPEIEIEMKYGNLLSTLLLTCFYAHALPAALLVAIVGLTANYWAEKWVFIRRIVLPRSLGKKIQDEMSEYLEWTIFAFTFGSLLFSAVLQTYNKTSVYYETNNSLIWIAIVISSINMILPAKIYEKLFCCAGDKDLEQIDYESARLIFLTDYDVENPLTKRKALKKYMEIVKKNSFISQPFGANGFLRQTTINKDYRSQRMTINTFNKMKNELKLKYTKKKDELELQDMDLED